MYTVDTATTLDRAGIVDSLNMLDTLEAMGLTGTVKTMRPTGTTDRVALLAMMKTLAPSAMVKMMVVLSGTVKIVRAVVAQPVDGGPSTLRRYTRHYSDSLQALVWQRTLARTLAPKETAPRASWPAP